MSTHSVDSGGSGGLLSSSTGNTSRGVHRGSNRKRTLSGDNPNFNSRSIESGLNRAAAGRLGGPVDSPGPNDDIKRSSSGRGGGGSTLAHGTAYDVYSRNLEMSKQLQREDRAALLTAFLPPSRPSRSRSAGTTPTAAAVAAVAGFAFTASSAPPRNNTSASTDANANAHNSGVGSYSLLHGLEPPMAGPGADVPGNMRRAPSLDDFGYSKREFNTFGNSLHDSDSDGY